jgi:hypothetical protein
MAKYRITAPDGGTYEITAPDGASEAEVLDYAKANIGQQAPPQKAGMLDSLMPRADVPAHGRGGASMQGPGGGGSGRRPIYSLELPDKRILDLEADDEASAIRGAEEWYAANPMKSPQATSEKWWEKAPLAEATKPIEIEGPDGSIVEFPAGTPGDVIKTALRKHFGASTGPKQADNWWEAAPLAARPDSAPKQAEMRAYEPSWQDRAGAAVNDAVSSILGRPTGERVAEGLVGSRGLGSTGVSAADFTPFGMAFAGQEAERAAGQGRWGDAALSSLALIPGARPAVQAARTIAAPVANDIARAAATTGVDLPRVAAIPEGKGRIRLGVAGKLKEIPLVGGPLINAQQKAVAQMDDAAGRITQGYAHGATPLSAGEAVKEGIAGWIRGDSKDVMSRLYGDVAKAIPADASRPLTHTSDLVTKLRAEDVASASGANAPAIKMIEEAVGRPQGLTYDGLRQLRTNIGAALDDALLPQAGTAKPALKRIYGAMTDDLRETVETLGGEAGKRAWDKANSVASVIAERRETLAKIVGKDGSRSPESVLDSIVRMAGTRSTADMQKLLQARKALGPEAWDEVSAATIQRLGRGSDNDFNLSRFVTNYKALSDGGRNLVFASTGKGSLKAELDDLAVVGEQYKKLQRLGNPSGTGGLVSMVGAGAGIVTDPLRTLGVVVGGYMLARSMAKPVRVKQITQYARTALNAGSGPGDAAFKLATINLARGLAEDGAGDQREIAAKLLSAPDTNVNRRADAAATPGPERAVARAAAPASSYAEVPRSSSEASAIGVPIEIEAPDGSIVEFPAGTSDDVIKGAMRKHFGSANGHKSARAADVDLPETVAPIADMDPAAANKSLATLMQRGPRSRGINRRKLLAALRARSRTV